MSNITYNPNYQNRGAYPRFGPIAVYDRSGNILYDTDGLAGILTGYQDDRSGAIPWLELIPVDGIHKSGYVQEDKVELRLAEEIAPYNAQVVIDQLIANDKQTLTNLLVCAGSLKNWRSEVRTPGHIATKCANCISTSITETGLSTIPI